MIRQQLLAAKRNADVIQQTLGTDEMVRERQIRQS